MGHSNPPKMKRLIQNAEDELSFPISRHKKQTNKQTKCNRCFQALFLNSVALIPGPTPSIFNCLDYIISKGNPLLGSSQKYKRIMKVN